MRRAVFALTAVLVIIFLMQPIAQVPVVKGNFYPFGIPQIQVYSPLSTQVYVTSNVDISFNYNVQKNVTIVFYFSYSLDKNANSTLTSGVSSLPSDFQRYSVFKTLENLTNGVHTLTVYAYFANRTVSSIMDTTITVDATFISLVFINDNGTIEPIDAPIQKEGEIYRLTGDIESIRIKRSNIVLDGNGHTVPADDSSSLPRGTPSNSNGVLLDNVKNVTVTNLTVKGVFCGIFLDRTTDCTIVNNTIAETTVPIPQLQATAGIFVWGADSNIITSNQITSNHIGICMGYFSEQNVVAQNNITENSNGIVLYDSSNNSIYQNNFVNNTTYQAQAPESTNAWDNGYIGNYWNDYNGTDANGGGIGDIPYIIDANGIDRYPLMSQVDTIVPNPTPTVPEFSLLMILLPFLSILFIVFFLRKRKYDDNHD